MSLRADQAALVQPLHQRINGPCARRPMRARRFQEYLADGVSSLGTLRPQHPQDNAFELGETFHGANRILTARPRKCASKSASQRRTEIGRASCRERV